MIYAIVITFVTSVLNAEYDALLIRRGKKPNHAMNLFMCLSLVGFLCLVQGFMIGLPMLFFVPLVFDNWLNFRRGLSFRYQPENPDSKIDQLENKLFGHKRAWLMSNLIYLSGFIAGIVLTLLK